MCSMEEKKNHGGARTGSGRKPIGEKPLDARYIVPMTHEQREKVKALGGAAWVRRKIDAAAEPKVKP